jgi:cobalt-zinc-cadmium resistance protein CzcA
LTRQVALPPGYTLTWEGQFENQRRAAARLAIVVPLSILAVFTLLFWAFQRLRYALLIMLNVPLALIGGIALLFFSGTNLSVSAMIGFIFLFGASVQNGLILVGQSTPCAPRARASTSRWLKAPMPAFAPCS